MLFSLHFSIMWSRFLKQWKPSSDFSLIKICLKVGSCFCTTQLPTGPVKISQFVHIDADDLILMKDVENHDRLFNI